MFNILFVVALGFVSAMGFKTYFETDEPVPANLSVATGKISDVSHSQRKNRLDQINFSLHGSNSRFQYTSIHPNIDGVKNHIVVDANAEVQFAPGKYQNSTNLWGLKIDGVEYLGPTSTKKAGDSNKRLGLLMGILAALAIPAVIVWIRRSKD